MMKLIIVLSIIDIPVGTLIINCYRLYSELQIRGGIDDNLKVFFLFLNENICCDPSLEPSQRDGSKNGSQHTFKRSNMENYP